MKAIIKLIFTTLLLVTGITSYAQQVVTPPFVQPDWTKPYQPFRIAGNLYYVGTYDLASYLIVTPQGNILINTGLDTSVPMLKANIEALGFKFSDIKILLATHAHYDHVGGMATVKKMTGATLIINEKDVQLMQDGGNSDYAMGGKGPTFAPAHVDRKLHDHDTITLGGTNIIALHHPGHTPGATSFLLTVKDNKRSYRVLIANMPSILDEANLTDKSSYPGIAADYAYTLRSLKGLKFDLWFASHASQFGLNKKHPQGTPYNPMAFHDPKGYQTELVGLQQKYDERLKKK